MALTPATNGGKYSLVEVGPLALGPFTNPTAAVGGSIHRFGWRRVRGSQCLERRLPSFQLERRRMWVRPGDAGPNGQPDASPRRHGPHRPSGSRLRRVASGRRVPEPFCARSSRRRDRGDTDLAAGGGERPDLGECRDRRTAGTQSFPHPDWQPPPGQSNPIWDIRY